MFKCWPIKLMLTGRGFKFMNETKHYSVSLRIFANIYYTYR